MLMPISSFNSKEHQGWIECLTRGAHASRGPLPTIRLTAAVRLLIAVPKAGVEVVDPDSEGQSTLRRCRAGHAKSRPGTYRCVRCPR